MSSWSLSSHTLSPMLAFLYRPASQLISFSPATRLVNTVIAVAVHIGIEGRCRSLILLGGVVAGRLNHLYLDSRPAFRLLNRYSPALLVVVVAITVPAELSSLTVTLAIPTSLAVLECRRNSQVMPDLVADGRLGRDQLQAGIPGHVVFTCRQRGDHGLAGAGIDIAVSWHRYRPDLCW
jgi:hypothetical protein